MANKTFTTIKSNVGSEVQDTSTAFATIIGRFVNRRYFQILRATNWKQTNTAHTLTLVSGTQNYVLPNDFYKEVAVYDVTNGVDIPVIDLDEMYRYNGDTISSSGAVDSCAIYSDAAIAQPSAASKLAITSSSASDSTQTIQIRGIASGSEVYETQTLTGTSAVSSTNTYTRITGISFDAARAGTVTITSNSAAVTNATIPMEMLDVRYNLMKFHYVPTAAATINVPYIIKPLPLSQDYDYPLIDIADLIEIGAVADAWRYKRQFAKSQIYELMFTQGISDYIFDQENQNSIFQFKPSTYDQGNLY